MINKTTKKICLYCKKTMEKPPYQSWDNFNKKKYCSNKCKGLAIKSNLSKECLVCHKRFRTFPYEYKSRKYCSSKCFGISHKGQKAWNTGKSSSEETKKKLRKAFLGSKSFLWKDGRSYNKEYCNWSRNKRNRLLGRTFPKHTFGEWQQLKKRFNYTCNICGRKEPKIKLTIDHIIPLSKEGNDEISNIQPLCRSCNSRKHNKIIYDQCIH